MDRAKTGRLADAVRWVAVSEDVPDEGVTVLVFAPKSSEPVWLGYLDGLTADGYVWCVADGSQIEGVTHWADMLAGPVVESNG